MKINSFRTIRKVFFDHLDFISKNVLLSENVIMTYILLAMFYELRNFNLQCVTLLEHEHVKRNYFKMVYKKVGFLS